MTSWLGIVLAAAFGLVTAHRGVCRDAPGAVMAAGMAAMSPGMGGIGPDLVHGPWWAAGFAAVAVWPLVRPPAGGVCGGPATHLLGGVAMVDMCVLPAMASTAGASVPMAGPAMAGVPMAGPAMAAVPMAPPGHHHSMPGVGAVDLPGAPLATHGPLGTALTLLGWALACYFLLATIAALTRRGTGGTPAAARSARLGEAAMGLGTALMLTAFT